MKVKEFKTSKGEFVLVDLPNAIHVMKHNGYIVQSCSSKLDCLNKCNRIDNGDVKGFLYIGNTEGDFKLSDITEQQAIEIVDSRFIFQTQYIKDMLHCYLDYENNDWVYKEALPSLHSLIKSKGIYLYENPLGNLKVYKKNFKGHDMFYSNYTAKWQEAEQKTFYNPYIFKKI